MSGLIRRSQIHLSADLVREIGANNAIVLQQIQWWANESRRKDAGWITMTLDELSERTGLTKQVVYRCIDWLRSNDYLVSDGKNRAMRYAVTEKGFADLTIAASRRSPSRPRDEPSRPRDGCGDSTVFSLRSNDEGSADAPSLPLLGRDFEPKGATKDRALDRARDLNPRATDEFAEFYAAYPRHVAKDAALKAYVAARGRASVEEILAGALRYRDDPARDPKFTKHPATWLNQGCWDDELLPSARAGVDRVIEW